MHLQGCTFLKLTFLRKAPRFHVGRSVCDVHMRAELGATFPWLTFFSTCEFKIGGRTTYTTSTANILLFFSSSGWESQLLETGFLGMFLCPLWTLSRLPRSTPPSSIVIWGFRWLIFRIMLGAVSGALWLGFWVLSWRVFLLRWQQWERLIPAGSCSLGRAPPSSSSGVFLVRRKELGAGNASCSVSQSLLLVFI